MDKADGSILAERWGDGDHVRGVSTYTVDHSRRSLRKAIKARYFSGPRPGLLLSPLDHRNSASSSNESLDSSSSSRSSYSGPLLSLSSQSSVSGYAKFPVDETDSWDDDYIDFPHRRSLPHLGHAHTAPSTGEVESSPVSSVVSGEGDHAFVGVVADDSMIREEPSRHVDYLSHDWKPEDLWATWSHIRSRRMLHGNTSRLENALWRRWARSLHVLQTVPPQNLNWFKESDITWLYGPLNEGKQSKLTSNVDTPSISLHINDPPKEKPLVRKGILKKRTEAEKILHDTIAPSSLIKEAAVTPARPSVNFSLDEGYDGDDRVLEPIQSSFSVMLPGFGVASVQLQLRKGRISLKFAFPCSSSPGALSIRLSLYDAIPMRLLQFLRPRVKSEHERLEWRCSCGREMYGDYAKHDTIRTSTYNVPSPDSRKNALRRLTNWALAFRRHWDLEADTNGSSQASKEDEAADNDGVDNSSAPVANPGVTQSASGSRNFSRSNTSDSSNGTASESFGPISDTSSSRSVSAVKLADNVPAFFELCVNGSKTRVSLGEITIRDSQGKCYIKTDMQLFKKIHTEYQCLRRKGLYTWLYRPNNIHFVRFGIHRGGFQTGIYEKPLAVPPAEEVKEHRYHYSECPLDSLPPMDRGTFFHYFWDHAAHPESSGHAGFDTIFFNRLPKKLGESILKRDDPGKLQLGWGVHIIEGPNKPLLAWLATGILVLSFIISLAYDLVLKNRESGFAIGQWIVAVLGTALTAMYFHLADLV